MTTETKIRIYAGVLVIIAASLGMLAAWVWPMTMDTVPLWLPPALVLLVWLAGLFPVKMSPQADATLFTVPVLIAVLLLHPSMAIIVAVAGTAISETMLKPPAVRVAVLNIGLSGVTAGAAGLIFWGLQAGTVGLSFTPGMVLAAVATGLVLHTTNLSLLAGAVTLVKGFGVWQIWKKPWMLDATLEAGMLTLGLIAAFVVLYYPMALFLFIIPFTVGSHVFRKGVSQAVQKAELAELKTKMVGEVATRRNELKVVQARRAAEETVTV
ncbi:MAG: hypothetical protein IIB15_03755 [Chloroflexi bacterium]|nr:hypothetical protein [Chloroflexota bacterium]